MPPKKNLMWLYTVTQFIWPVLGEKITKNVPIETNEDDGSIQLISYSAKLNSPTSDQSGPDSAFEDMQSSMTSNDQLSNTIEEFMPEEYVTAEKVDKVESAPKKEGKSENSRPKQKWEIWQQSLKK